MHVDAKKENSTLCKHVQLKAAAHLNYSARREKRTYLLKSSVVAIYERYSNFFSSVYPSLRYEPVFLDLLAVV